MKTIKIFILVSLFFGFTSVFSQQTENNLTKGDTKAVIEKVDTEQWPEDRPPPNFNPEKKNEAVNESQAVDVKNNEKLDEGEFPEDRPRPNWVPPVKKEKAKGATSREKSQSPEIDESTGKEMLTPKTHDENNKDPNKL